MQEMCVLFLGQEEPLEKENSNPLQFLAWKNLMDRGAWQATVHEVARVRYDLMTKPHL